MFIININHKIKEQRKFELIKLCLFILLIQAGVSITVNKNTAVSKVSKRHHASGGSFWNFWASSLSLFIYWFSALIVTVSRNTLPTTKSKNRLAYSHDTVACKKIHIVEKWSVSGEWFYAIINYTRFELQNRSGFRQNVSNFNENYHPGAFAVMTWYAIVWPEIILVPIEKIFETCTASHWTYKTMTPERDSISLSSNISSSFM